MITDTAAVQAADKPVTLANIRDMHEKDIDKLRYTYQVANPEMS